MPQMGDRATKSYVDDAIDTDIATHAAIATVHHAKYTDAEAVAAMGAKANDNPLNHDRAEEWGATEHTAIGNNAPHHARYTDAEAVAAVGAVADIGARVYHDANQTVATATYTALALNSERWDNDDIHDPTTDNSRLTCKTAGKYIIVGNVSIAQNATGYRSVGIRLNGTTNIAYFEIPNGHASRATWLSISSVYDLAVNDYVELMVEQGSGGNLLVNSVANFSPEFMIQKIG